MISFKTVYVLILTISTNFSVINCEYINLISQKSKLNIDFNINKYPSKLNKSILNVLYPLNINKSHVILDWTKPHDNNNKNNNHHNQKDSSENVHKLIKIKSNRKTHLKNDSNKRPIVSDFKQKPLCSKTTEGQVCTEAVNYPAKSVEDILKMDFKSYEHLFGDDAIVTTPNPNNTDLRLDLPADMEESLCGSFERIIYPQAGLRIDNSWGFIINQPNYTQGIRVEECINPGRSCHMSEPFPNGYRTECKQMFIYRQLLSIGRNGLMTKDLFRLPSCCKCILKYDSF